MEHYCEEYSEVVKRECGNEYSVIFEDTTQNFEIQQYIEKQNRTTTVCQMPEWSRKLVNDLKMWHYESREMDFDEWREMVEKERKLEEERVEKEQANRREELAHDVYHMSGKRVY